MHGKFWQQWMRSAEGVAEGFQTYYLVLTSLRNRWEMVSMQKLDVIAELTLFSRLQILPVLPSFPPEMSASLVTIASAAAAASSQC